MVSEREIIDELKKGANSTADIQNVTRAGTSCGRCLKSVDHLVKEFLLKNTSSIENRSN
jgi:NAD(P)H-nitrite reductase large subunit